MPIAIANGNRFIFPMQIASYVLQMSIATTNASCYFADAIMPFTHVNRSACPSKNANQRNSFHGEVLHTIGD